MNGVSTVVALKVPVVSSPPPALSLFVYRATVVEVLDALTFVANLDFGFRTWRCGQPFRLANLVLGENQAPQEAEAKLRELIGDKSVILQVVDDSPSDGNALAKVWVSIEAGKSISVNGFMTENKLAQQVKG